MGSGRSPHSYILASPPSRTWHFGIGRRHLFATSRGGRSVSRSTAPLVSPEPENQVIALETLVSTLVSLPPTLFIAVMAATAISEAISVYSMAVAPRSFFMSLRKIDSILIPEFLGRKIYAA